MAVLGVPTVASYTFCLALRFLRADAPADSGKAVGRVNDRIGAFIIVLFDLPDEFGYAHFNRTSGDTLGVFALKAAVCF